LGKERLNLLLISGIYPPDIGGPATYLPKLAKHLVSQGHNVSVVSLTDSQHIQRLEDNWPSSFVLRNSNKIIRTLRIIKLIRRKAKCSDFVFSNGLYVETAIALIGLKKTSTAKIVGDPVWEKYKNKSKTDLSIDDFSKKNVGPGPWLLRKIYNYAINTFDNLTAPSKNLALNISNWGINERVQVIHNGVSCIKPEPSKLKYDVVSVARLVPWKNIDKLIRACSKANLSLAVVGDGPESERLKALAERYGSGVTFMGQLEENKVLKVLNESKIFALISSYEGLSFALIEAMMTEKRILVSFAPGNIEVISDNIEGVVVDPDDVSQITEKLIYLNSDYSENENLGKNARLKSVSLYCEENQLSKMCDLITKTSS
jgi:glycosyltransferase involved in cell wall biosynthesis